MSLQLEIVTPEKRVYNKSVDSVVLPTAKGEVGILPGHIPMVFKLEPGELEVIHSGQTEYLAVDRGFAHVLGDQVKVLAEAAIDVAEINPEEVAEARRRALAALEEARNSTDLDPTEIEQLEAVSRFALVQEMAKGRRAR